jgi:hypothetical protein
METLLACNIARDEGFITKLEFETLRREKFSKLGGIIGEMPHTNLDFLEFCFYPGPCPEEGEKDE